MNSGGCIWLTGLPAAGKTTIAALLTKILIETMENDPRVAYEWIDGDIARHSFSHDLGYSKADRDENLRRCVAVASHLVHSGLIVICSLTSPFRADRLWASKMIPNFREVFVECPVEVCIHRDAHDEKREGLYQKALDGIIPDFTGIQEPYEVPHNPALTINTHTECLAESMHKLLALEATLRSA